MLDWLGFQTRARWTAVRALLGSPGGREAYDRPAGGIASFPATLSDPRFMSQPYGFSNVRLDVQAGVLTVFPSPAETLMHGWWDPLEYRWPAVVLERLRPLPHTCLLVDVHGSFGFCAVRQDGPLREALAAAGFDVIDVAGWDMPRRVRRDDVGDRFDQVPQFARES